MQAKAAQKSLLVFLLPEGIRRDKRSTTKSVLSQQRRWKGEDKYDDEEEKKRK